MDKTVETKSRIRTIFDHVSHFYEEKANPRYTELEAAVLQELLQDVQGTLLDIGVGTGRFLNILNKRGEVIGLDISRKMIETAKSKGCKLLIVGDAERIPLADDSVDLVTVIEVIQYMPNPRAVIDEIWRVLRNGGCGIFAIPNTSWYVFLEILDWLKITSWPEFTVHTLSLSSYESTMRSRGFKIERVKKIRYLPFFPPIARVLQVRKSP